MSTSSYRFRMLCIRFGITRKNLRFVGALIAVPFAVVLLVATYCAMHLLWGPSLDREVTIYGLTKGQKRTKKMLDFVELSRIVGFLLSVVLVIVWAYSFKTTNVSEGFSNLCIGAPVLLVVATFVLAWLVRMVSWPILTFWETISEEGDERKAKEQEADAVNAEDEVDDSFPEELLHHHLNSR